MADQVGILKALSTKEEAVTPTVIAQEVRSTDSTVTTLLHKLKKKGHVEGGGKEWMITDAGRKEVEKGGGVVTTVEDVGEDEVSKFQYFGQLAGADSGNVEAALEIFKNEDMRSMEAFDKVMADINIPQVNRHRWRSLYLAYLRNTTAPEERDAIYPVPKVAVAEVVKPAAEERGKDGDEPLDYLVEDNKVVRVGDGLGMFTFRQSLQVVTASRGISKQPEDGGSSILNNLADVVMKLKPDQAMTPKEIIDLIKEVVEKKPDERDPPVQAPGFFVDEGGNVHELKAGQPIVVKRVEQQAGKTFILQPDGELVEQEAGKPLVIKVQGDGGGGGGGMPQMLPFPIMGSDGQVVHDKDGNPVYANLEPMMKYMGFASDQKRAGERHSALMGLAQTVKENLGDGIAALKAAAEQAKGSSIGSKESSATEEAQPQVYSCAGCGSQFSTPPGWAGETVKCPNPGCDRQYTKEDLQA